MAGEAQSFQYRLNDTHDRTKRRAHPRCAGLRWHRSLRSHGRVSAMRVMSVVGARPQFVKLAPIDAAFREAGIDHVIVHTGQHYDPMLSDVFFSDLGISAPDVHLGVGSGSHGVQTGTMLAAMDETI